MTEQRASRHPAASRGRQLRQTQQSRQFAWQLVKRLYRNEMPAEGKLTKGS